MAAIVVTVAAVLLLVAGGAKIARPEPASNALGVVGLSAPPILVRIGAGIEMLIALAALVLPGPIPSILVGASYLAFAGFVLLLRRHPEAESCGCFGVEDEPPSWRHVVVNLLVGVGCLGAAATSSPSVAALWREDWITGLLFVVLSLTAAWLVGLVLRTARWSFGT